MISASTKPCKYDKRVTRKFNIDVFKLCSCTRICISERLPFINFKGNKWNDKELKGDELNDVQL